MDIRIEKENGLSSAWTIQNLKYRRKLWLRCGKDDVVHKRNLLATATIDIALGIAACIYILNNVDLEFVASMIVNSSKMIGKHTDDLLTWLMGAPVGLKLNKHLAEFLGMFFKQHIVLWSAWLQLMYPHLPLILKGLAMTGCFGLSTLLSSILDFTFLITFYVSCFYVYAARIYCLQVRALLSLWRLFRGKKWNELRQRVDSCDFTIDQLFLGTLIFTILLFLLPTVSLNYFVFVAMRIAIVAVQGVGSWIIDSLTYIPLYSLYLWLTKNSLVSQGVYFEYKIEPNGDLILYRNTTLMKVSEFVKITAPSSRLDDSVKNVFFKTLHGDLIKRWGSNFD